MYWSLAPDEKSTSAGSGTPQRRRRLKSDDGDKSKRRNGRRKGNTYAIFFKAGETYLGNPPYQVN